MATHIRPPSNIAPGPETIGADPFVPHRAPGYKTIPQNGASANWIIMKAREDGIKLPSKSLFRFNLGRQNPWPVVVNARSQCTLHGNPDLHIPPSLWSRPGCGPNPYVPERYAPCL